MGYALKKIIDAKSESNQQPKYTKYKRNSGFTLFSSKKNKERKNYEEDGVFKDDECKDAQNENMLKQFNMINDKDLKHIQDLYKTYSFWLTENAQKCVDNKQIDEKQKELESKLGASITKIITD